jgi:hypothetical protein
MFSIFSFRQNGFVLHGVFDRCFHYELDTRLFNNETTTSSFSIRVA